MTADLEVAALMAGEQLRAEATAELERTIDDARRRYTFDAEFHARVKMLCQTMGLRGRVMDPEEAIDVMSALVVVERRSVVLRGQADAYLVHGHRQDETCSRCLT